MHKKLLEIIRCALQRNILTTDITLYIHQTFGMNGNIRCSGSANCRLHDAQDSLRRKLGI